MMAAARRWKSSPTFRRRDHLALKDVSLNQARRSVGSSGGTARQEHAAEKSVADHQAGPRAGRTFTGVWGRCSKSGTGFTPGLKRTRETFTERRDYGDEEGRDRPQFDEIVAFAEVEKFMTRPSSTTRVDVRATAFAVAAHLEPDILLVDEVLAVGDAAFQKKCLGKMGDVAKHGRTVLFVSHNMAAIRRLCFKRNLF